ncbi:MAG: VOC family protein, partial [Planctomycetota bacterium]
ASENSDLRPGALSFWVRVEDIGAVYEKCIELGARPNQRPAKKPWGDVLASVFDPDGNLLGLSQKRGE